MTERPDLHASISAVLAAQQRPDPAGWARPGFDRRAAVFDAAAARADEDPSWFSVQPSHVRTAVANWKAWRINNPKPQETAA